LKGGAVVKKKWKGFFALLSVLCISVLTITSCGGGGGSGSSGTVNTGNANLQTGQLIDSVVEGVEYQTATQSGLTDANGNFVYLPGETVSFYIGGVPLGHAIGANRLTPVDLVIGAVDETNPTVTNICRLLISLDVDGDPSNGISITAAIRGEVEGRPIDFTIPNDEFSANVDVQALLDSLNQLGVFTSTGLRILTTSAFAQSHLRTTLYSLLSGEHSGTFSGPTSGNWSFTVDCSGAVTGTATSITPIEDQGTTAVYGQIASSGDISLAAGTTSDGTVWQGTFRHAEGAWNGTYHDNDNGSGTFTGSQTSVGTCP
jgi:hypothetical protein